MRSKVAGADPYSPDLSRNERLGGMSYEEWKQQAGARFYSRLFGEKAVPKYTGDDFIDGKQFDRSKIHYSSGGKSLQRRLDRAGIEYREVQALPAPLSDDEIINRVGGRDMTDGSCFPLACAYIGNKHGLDVLDFRGGDSLELFRDGFTNITHLNGITGKYSHKSDANQLMKMIGMMEEGKEYMLTGGNHTSIVRLNNGIPEYLALHRDQNGWLPFEEDKILKDGSKRHQSIEEGIKKVFHCYGKLVDESSLIDIDQFKDSDEFRDLLGYINTEENRQRKKR